MVIYQIENKLDNKIYIGQTKRRLKSRLKDHLDGKSSYISKALRKYGIENFNIQIIDHAETKEELDEKEKYWIETLDCKAPNGYNLTSGGDGISNPSEDTRIKMRNARLGKKASEETKRKISESGKGRIVDDETKERMRAKNIGQKRSEETCEKLRLSHKGKQSSFLGKKHSEETKQKISDKVKGRFGESAPHKTKHTEETKNKISQKVHEHMQSLTLEEKRERGIGQGTKGKGGTFLGKKHSEETKQKISSKAKGRTPWNKGLKQSKNKISEV